MIILAAVLGTAALLVIALVGLGVMRDSSARPTVLTPASIAEPTTDVLPMVVPPTDAPPTPMIAVQPPAESPSPAMSVTELTPTSAPLPTDTPLPPTETPALLPTETPPAPTETPAPLPTDTPAAQRATYTVQQGDTCWAIATRFNITLNDLIRLNNLTTECLIRPGQELVITP